MVCRQWRSTRISFVVLLLFVSLAWSQTDGFNPFIIPDKGVTVKAGSTWMITWEPTPKFGTKVTLSTLYGPTELTQRDGPIIATRINVKRGRFAWKIPTDFPQAATYGLKIALVSDPSKFQYSYPFSITFKETADPPVVVVTATTSSPAPAVQEPVTVPPTTLETIITKEVKKTITSQKIVVSSSILVSGSVTVVQQVTITEVNESVETQTTVEGNVNANAVTETLVSTAPATRVGNKVAGETQPSPTQVPGDVAPTTPSGPNGPLSGGAKAGIGIGAGIGGIFLLITAWLSIRRYYMKQGEQMAFEQITGDGGARSGAGGVVWKGDVKSDIELEAVKILSDEEKKELLNRRRAAELAGEDFIPIVEKEGGEMDELEARRKRAKEVHEIG